MLRYLAVALVLSSWSTIAGAVDVTTCDQLVPVGQVGEVLNDLDCSAGSFFGVSLGAGATLHLNGHRLNGPTAGGAIVQVLKSATIVGPGEIDTSPEGACIQASYGSLVVDGGTGIDIHGCYDGIDAQYTSRIANVSVHDNTEIGLYAGGHLIATNVSANGNRFGVTANTVIKLRNVTAVGNLYGGIADGKIVSLVDSTIDASGVYGIRTNGQVSLANSVVSNSGGIGILAKSVRLKDSSVTGTGALPDDDYPPNIDLDTAKNPKLHNSTCGKSWGKRPPPHRSGMVGTWGVCTND